MFPGKKTRSNFIGFKIIVKSIISTILFYIRTYFLTGIAVLLPSALTLYVIITLFHWADSGFIADFTKNLTGYKIPGLGFIFTISAIILSGVFAKNFIGQKIFGFVENLLLRIPLAKNIITAIRQLLDFMKANRKSVFNKAILVEYPRRDCWVIGFVSTDAPKIVREALNEDNEVRSSKLISVFIPTTPNPTSGFLVFVPKKEVVELEITMEEAMKIVISGGVLSPENEQEGFQVEDISGE
ncbi:MAG: hypothetical protein C0601_00365 [Candidatus Muiribacterium halophilum]|uniref:DUF502 domain-containing protein n=1 Tax=Muiribacterium halophilum TaxID=2053465 RepID=A0A2N5ZN03_MUIH1|nr:MAG: hypothetical protein C0601_00365 [Candidatus Muirbacterium halophilum]